MCITFPGQVLEVLDGHAVVEIDGRRRRASTLLEPTVAVGDWVLVGAGTVLRRLADTDAAALAHTLTTARASTDARRPARIPGGLR